ncbi:DNA polymerase-4 [Pseudoduganella lurida]|uniref:DNA polymerase IV n=1 Tax=Pseudoduganella lurida TaxID=1036180 RepID=A0A562QWB3_9BURK|nr:DNA polymerase IV [Pseudoduganella lurida]TWI60426.1 DNA polymerase-4 [Pseudoduganella lurida]
MDQPRRIAHLDMDAFFASVELLRYPELRGLPVVVGGGARHQPVVQEDGTRRFSTLRDYAGRGVVTTSTYEARALGVFSAMGTMKAAALAPDAILLPTDFESYKRYSRLFKEAVATIVPDIEDRGIDEIYLDLTSHPEETRALGMRLKRAVNEATGLTCSIGIAPNKLLAKICSDLDKPDGLTVVSFDDVPTRIWPLSAKKINGIGPKAYAKLVGLGIETVGQLAQADPKLLQEHFGLNSAEWLRRVAHGHDEREVVTRSDPKGVSRETTFERDLHVKADRDALSEIFTRLCTRLSEDLHRKRYAGRTVGIKLRYADFRTVTRDVTLPEPTADAATIRRAAGECLRRVPLDQRLRLLGVRVSALVPLDELDRHRAGQQGELFGY